MKKRLFAPPAILLLAGALAVFAQTPPPSASPAAPATPAPAPGKMSLDEPITAPAGDPPVTAKDIDEALRHIGAEPSLVKRAPIIPHQTKEQNTTEVTAMEATFEEKTHTAIFLKDVFVDNPEFNVNCDKLTAYLKHTTAEDPNGTTTASQAAPATPVPSATPKATPAVRGKGARGATAAAKATPTPKPTVIAGAKPATPSDAKTGGLDKAIAEGNVLITQDKVEPDGTVSHNVGHAKRAFYDANTGDISLYGRPDASRGLNTVVALDENTVIVLNRDGRMKVYGPHKTTIKDQGNTDSSK